MTLFKQVTVSWETHFLHKQKTTELNLLEIQKSFCFSSTKKKDTWEKKISASNGKYYTFIFTY